MGLHPAPTDTRSAKCQQAPGAHLRKRGHISIYWSQNGWLGVCVFPPPPLSQIHKSPLSLDFIVGEAVKNFLPHLQDFLVAAVPNSWEKPGGFSSLWVARVPPSPREGGRAGAPPAPGSGKTCRSGERKHPSQVGASNPPWGSSALFCWWRLEGQSSSMGENGKSYYGRR